MKFYTSALLAAMVAAGTLGSLLTEQTQVENFFELPSLEEVIASTTDVQKSADFSDGPTFALKKGRGGDSS